MEKIYQNEEWRPVINYEEYYHISNYGRVKILAKYVENDGNFAGGFVKKLNIKEIAINRDGYCVTKLCKLGKCKQKKVHRLVADAFLPNPLKHKQVNHIDGNKQNNHVSNLEWCSAAENMKHAWATGLINSDHSQGSKCNFAKLNEETVLEIRRLYDNKLKRYSELLREFEGLTPTMLKGIIKRKTWKHI